MSIKGYTREEMQQKEHEKRVKAVWTVAILQMVIILLNVALTIAGIGLISAIVCVLLFVGLWGAFVKAVDMLAEEGYNVKKFKIFKIVSLIAFFITFAVAIFS